VKVELGVGVCSMPYSRTEVRGICIFYSILDYAMEQSKQAMHVLSKPYFHLVRSAAKQVESNPWGVASLRGFPSFEWLNGA
jgi:hypothetical protein